MKKSLIDIINTGLIVISIALAYLFPLELFILSYAILGPLHYFTEINWIKDQHYFLDQKSIWLIFAIALSLIFSIPYLLNLDLLASLFSSLKDQKETVLEYKKYINWTLFIGLIAAFSLLFFKKVKYILGTLALGIFIAVLLNSNQSYNILFGTFLPTIIHVYFFTILFMLFGTLKSGNLIGFVNVVLVLLVPLFFIYIQVNPKEYSFTPLYKETFLASKFHHLNAIIAKLFKLKNELSFYFYELIDLKIQMFIAFAYTYHYLNWFSKTTVIGWHKKITTKKATLIGGLWILSIAIYFYDYKIGFAFTLFYSVLHVILEFPLNILTIKSLFKKTN